MSDSVQPHRRQPTRLHRPWDSPGKNTGVGFTNLPKRTVLSGPCMDVVSICWSTSPPGGQTIQGVLVVPVFSVPLLQLPSRFSRVRLRATPETAAHQAPPSLGFSRQEHWSGLLFPSPMHESESEVAQSCPTLGDPVDCSLPGSSVHGIFRARVLEWSAIAFSGNYANSSLY